jgi:hypothetical protein
MKLILIFCQTSISIKDDAIIEDFTSTHSANRSTYLCRLKLYFLIDI